MAETVIVLDFGGQYNQLIARRVREAHVYCELLACQTPLEDIKKKNPVGIILTGGPASVNVPDAPTCDPGVFAMGVPVLGICYGHQLMNVMLGGLVTGGNLREYGRQTIQYQSGHPLLDGLPEEAVCWMSHTNTVDALAEGFSVLASTSICPMAAIADDSRKLYGVQFHPEVVHTEKGQKILTNFLYKICGCKGDWNMEDFAHETIAAIRKQVGDKKVLCALSGGVDSSVAAMLVHKAIGKQLTCIFVDHGLLRKDEGDEVEQVFSEGFDLNLIRVNAQQRFLDKLSGVIDPEAKRKIIGEEFIRVFEEEARKIGAVEYLVQGTIYPDVVESGTGQAAVIKSHHNVGGLPEHVDFEELIEPLRELFKDEVRKVGEALGLPKSLVWRQPFPGPGLAIRVIGEITEERLTILKEADAIFREEVKNAGLESDIWQYFAVLTGMRSVGVMGDERTYDYTIALRAVTSVEAMTADWARIPHEVLARMSNRIVNEVRYVNRVVYDITSKPPATIEWE